MLTLRSPWAAWPALIAATLLVTAVLRAIHLPAALVLGPMATAIAFALWRPGLRLPPGTTTVAQAVLGCLIASAISPELLAALLPAWPTLLGLNLLATLAIMALGLWAAQRHWLPGTAAIWGMSPGGASAMVMLSESHGADRRLVALMQYLRLLVATLSVVAVGLLFGQPAQHAGLSLPGAAGVPWWSPVTTLPVAATAALAVASVAASLLLRRPTLAILMPVFAGIALQASRWTHVEVPPLASAAAFALIGWHVGLGFTKASLVESARLLPRVLLCIAGVLAVSAVMAALLAALMGIDFITAYMALNPGGMDAVVLMAASIHVDLPLIIAMQMTRLMLVIAFAPVLGRLASRRHLASQAAER